MTALRDRLAARIAREGPIGIAEFMTECLLHPVHGYYATRDPLGVAGDFTTSPEISQMFGELVGLWLAQAWADRGGGPVVLAELGPGRGTLMADALRATARVPGFRDAADLWLVEASPVLRRRQAAALAAHAPCFADTVADLPEAPLLVVANEFFDALPVRQFQRGRRHWHERQVGLDGAGRLAIGLAPETPVPDLDPRADLPEGAIVEVSAARSAIMGEIGRRIAAHGGAGLIIDYGGAQSIGDTLQAVAGHVPVDPLDRPGAADLTTHVDFGALARAAAPATAHGPVAQGAVLRALGIDARAEALAAGLSGTALDSHRAAHRRLTGADEMGTLFKVLAVGPAGASLPLFAAPEA